MIATLNKLIKGPLALMNDSNFIYEQSLVIFILLLPNVRKDVWINVSLVHFLSADELPFEPRQVTLATARSFTDHYTTGEEIGK